MLPPPTEVSTQLQQDHQKLLKNFNTLFLDILVVTHNMGHELARREARVTDAADSLTLLTQQQQLAETKMGVEEVRKLLHAKELEVEAYRRRLEEMATKP